MGQYSRLLEADRLLSNPRTTAQQLADVLDIGDVLDVVHTTIEHNSGLGLLPDLVSIFERELPELLETERECDPENATALEAIWREQLGEARRLIGNDREKRRERQ